MPTLKPTHAPHPHPTHASHVWSRALCCGTIATLALAGGLLAGCESDASAGGKGPVLAPAQRAEAAPAQTDEFAKLGYRLEWRAFPTMLPGEHIDRVDLFGDVLAVQESAGVLSVIETRSGQVRWSEQVAGRLTKFVGTLRDEKNPDHLIVSSETEAYFYDVATGNLRARQKFAQIVSSAPVQVGDMLVYGCLNGQVLGHLTLNGYRQWGAGLTGTITTSPLELASGRVAVVSSTGDFAVIDGATGLSQGRARMFAGPADGVQLASDGAVTVVASADQSLYAFGGDTASSLWRKRTDAPLKFTPSIHEGKVYCDLGADGFTCLEAVTGKPVWNNAKVSGSLVGIRNKRLVVFNGTTAWTLDSAKGSIIERVELKNVSVLKPDAFVDGNLYVAAPSGIITKFSPR